MRKICAAALGAAAIGSVLMATPASAHCVSTDGSEHPLIVIPGPWGDIKVNPGEVDIHPIDCVTVVTDLIGEGPS